MLSHNVTMCIAHISFSTPLILKCVGCLERLGLHMAKNWWCLDILDTKALCFCLRQNIISVPE
jgi:hypothetical protein